MANRALPEAELDALRAHVDDCDVCGAALLALIRASAPMMPGPSSEMPTGTQIGRFTLHEVLGSGNMGTVFTARDPQLDRVVAIKVLRAGRDDARDAARLLREAKAMAQVRHPNVVTVYEVGQDQDVIFVAMEQVRGATLRARLKDRELPVAVRLDWLAQIGRALAAIHAARLVHRDLKPENIFVEDVENPERGSSPHRVVIGDFGLAAADASAAGRESAGSLATGTRSAGTPAYMPPEQLRGDPLDARADVFAFGVTAWEVLTGARPFEGRTATELEASIRRGPVESAAFAALPAALRRVLARCVHHDRDQRPRSVTEVLRVLRALEHRPRRRGVVIAGLGLGALAVVSVLFVTLTSKHATPAAICDPDARARWETTRSVWLARAHTLSPYVRDALVEKMDQRATAWSRGAAAACQRDVLAQQVWRLCRPTLEELEQRVLDVAIEASWPDDRPIVQTLDQLATPAYCGSSEAAEDAVALSALPSDAARAAVTDGLGWLERAEALNDLGAVAPRDEALAKAAQIAAAIAPSPLDGELALARVELAPPATPRDQATALQAAAATAERSGRASLIARAWMALAESRRGVQLELTDAAIEAALAQADYAISRLGDPPRLRVKWLVADGTRTWSRDRAAAKARFAAATKLAGDDRALAWSSKMAVAKLASLEGDYRGGADVLRDFLADPELMHQADPENQLILEAAFAECLYHLGQLPEAQQAIERAIELGRTALPPNHPTRIEHQLMLASIVLERGDKAAALSLLATVTAQARASLGPDHVVVAQALTHTAQALMYADRVQEGLVPAREAARIYALREGSRSEEGITARFLVADAHRSLGKLDESAKEYAELLADAEAVFGTAHPMWAQYARGEADLLIALHRTDEARALLERAIPVLEKASPDIAAFAKLTLADIIESRDHDRAIALATEAETAFGGDPAWKEYRDGATQWLREHRRRQR